MDINASIEDWRQNGYDFQQGIKLLSLLDPGHSWEKYKGLSFAPFSDKGSLKKCLLKFEGENPELLVRAYAGPKIKIGNNETPSGQKNIFLGLKHGNKITTGTNSVNIGTSASTPESIILIKEKCKQLHKSQELAHSQMRIAEHDKQRYKFAKQIMEQIIPELRRNYDMIRVWEDTGILPPSAAMDIIKDTVEKSKQILSIAPRISKLKKLIKEARTIDDREKYQKELEEKEIQLEGLKTELQW